MNEEQDSKKRKLTHKELSEWQKHPISLALKNEYENRCEALKNSSMLGSYVKNWEGYIMDVGYVKALEEYLNVWDDEGGFLDYINHDRVDDPEEGEDEA